MIQKTEMPLLEETRREFSYQISWRFRATHPWNREQFSSRTEAHNRFIGLIRRGIEARIEADDSQETSAGNSIARLRSKRSTQLVTS